MLDDGQAETGQEFVAADVRRLKHFSEKRGLEPPYVGCYEVMDWGAGRWEGA